MVDGDRIILIDQKFCLGFPVNEGEVLEEELLAKPKLMEENRSASKGFKLQIPEPGMALPIHRGNAQSLLVLLRGEETKNILRQFQAELCRSRREAMGHIVLKETMVEGMVESINLGIIQGFEKISKLFSNNHAIELLFFPRI